jgi:hypothetical protein
VVLSAGKDENFDIGSPRAKSTAKVQYQNGGFDLGDAALSRTKAG